MLYYRMRNLNSKIEAHFMKNFNLLFSDIKNFMANEVNRMFVLFIIINIVMGIFLYFKINQLENVIKSYNNQLAQEIIKTRKRVDFRYFNTTRMLENIYDVRFDTKNGDVK